LSRVTPTALDGVWEMVRAECAGEAAPELVVQRTEIELAQGEYRVRFAGQLADRGQFEIGAAGDMPRLILRGRHGPNAGRTIPCIFQLKGERLRICYGLDGVPPVAFATQAGDQRYLATYRRKPAAAG
jgi:uncharacterized protein (TIGR03067 family)